ncbi:DUF3631 domain-containing protein [Nocardia terpenica]|uniref:DUF3631 domain-containing protein n=1 Tax=Nocardia terpenica TaxID=455432 RepID=UPI002FE016DF
MVRSPEKRSGKSRLLEVVDPLVHEPLRAVNATVAYIFRSLAADPPPTLLFDEADTVFGSKKVAEQNEDLRGLLNAGFQRGLPFGRTVGPNHRPVQFETFAMAALAGIGRMPDTIEDRAVVVVMRRRKPTEVVQPYRTRRDRPRLAALHERLRTWADSIREELTGYEPEHLGVEDRAADVWEPLIAVADQAGGDWPTRSRAAAVAMVAEAADAEGAESLNARLLDDIRTVFADEKVMFIKSAQLCERLCGLEESPWKGLELNPSKLGRRLREYGITTGFADYRKTERGYRLSTFTDAFDRYLPAPKVSGGVHAARNDVELHQYPDTLENLDTFKASGNSNPSGHNASSDPIGAGTDGSGHHHGGNCPECGVDGVPVGYEFHHDCASARERQAAAK